jgi:hypothetical protein
MQLARSSLHNLAAEHHPPAKYLHRLVLYSTHFPLTGDSEVPLVLYLKDVCR